MFAVCSIILLVQRVFSGDVVVDDGFRMGFGHSGCWRGLGLVTSEPFLCMHVTEVAMYP
jgi:hypothetical protein